MGLLIRFWWLLKGLVFIVVGVAFQAIFCGVIGVISGFLVAMALGLDEKYAVWFGPGGLVFMLLLFNGLVVYYLRSGKYSLIGRHNVPVPGGLGDSATVARAFFLIPFGAKLVYQCFAEFRNPYKQFDVFRLACPHCAVVGKVEFVNRGTIDRSRFVCNACGRSFKHDEVEKQEYGS